MISKNYLQHRYFIPLLIVVVVFSVLFLLFQTGAKPSFVEPGERAWPVAVKEVVVKPRAPIQQLFGVIESPRFSQLGAGVTSFIQTMFAKEGQVAKQGDLLVQLDPREMETAIAQHLAEEREVKAQIIAEKNRKHADLQALAHEKKLLALITQEAEREKALKSRNLSSQAQLDKTLQAIERQALIVNERELAIADAPARLRQLQEKRSRLQAAIAQAQLDIERTKVFAPYSGRTAKRLVDEGAYVQKGETLIEFYDHAQLEVRAHIPNRLNATVNQSLRDRIPLQAQAQLDGRDLHLTLDRLAAQAERGRGGLDALFRIHKPDPLLPIGRLLVLYLQLPAYEKTISLPVSALYPNERVYKVVDGRLQAVTITRLGEVQSFNGRSYQLVRSTALQTGDQVLISALPNAMSGLLVNVTSVQKDE